MENQLNGQNPENKKKRICNYCDKQQRKNINKKTGKFAGYYRTCGNIECLKRGEEVRNQRQRHSYQRKGYIGKCNF